MGDDPYNQTHTANLIDLELTQEIWARDPWILKWHKAHKKRDLHSIRPYTSKSHPASHLSPSPPCFQWGETRPRFHADLFVHIQHPTNGVPFLTSLLNGLAEEQPGKAGSGIGFAQLLCQPLAPAWAKMSSCKASHGTGISKASTSSCIYFSFPPAAVRARGTTAPRQEGEKQLSPKASLSVPPQALLGAHPTSNKSSSRGKPDSLTITVISHPYVWLLSVEKKKPL